MTGDYIDDYANCSRTFCSLLVKGKELRPALVTEALGLVPTRSFSRGDPMHEGRPHVHRQGLWELSTDGIVDSRDLRRHVDWLLDRLQSKADVLSSLRQARLSTEVSCLYAAVSSGGPILSPHQTGRLAALGLEIWIDVYRDTPDPATVQSGLLPPLTQGLCDRDISVDVLAGELAELYQIATETVENIEVFMPAPFEELDEQPFDEFELSFLADLWSCWKGVRALELKELSSFGGDDASAGACPTSAST